MRKYLYLILLLASAALSYAQDPIYPAAPAAPLNIISAEYFVDSDPGIGNGTAITVTPGINISNTAAIINVNGLSNGAHRLSIRTRNALGIWSITETKDFLYDADIVYRTAPPAPQNILSAEYFIDTDPGAGSGTPITIAAGVDLNNVPVAVNTTGLSNGTHRLYIRSKSTEGRWSITSMKDFIVDFDFNYPSSPAAAQNIIAAEYFIDTDPGAGGGTAVSITAGLDLNNIAFAANTAGLTNGTHRLYFRTRSNEGRWSITHMRDFIVDADFSYPVTPVGPQNIIAAEYFIDTDPGTGNGTAVSVTAGLDINNITFPANTTGLAIGVHRLYFRTRSNEGRWSITNLSDFVVNADYSYPVTPASPQNIVAAEYFIDADPGVGAATAIPVSAGTDLNNIAVAANTIGLTSGPHNFYLRTKSQEGNWSISNRQSFAVGLLSLSSDTLVFTPTPLNNTTLANLIITNASATNQTINNVTTVAPFTTDFIGTRTILAGKSDSLKVSFTPVLAQAYQNTLTVQTTAGNFDVVLKGTGVAQNSTWTIDPATGHDYGSVATGSNSNFNFTIRNTGNIAIVLSSATSGNPAFAINYAAGTSIPAGATFNLPVSFNPASISSYTAQLKIKSSTAGVDSVTTSLSGIGYTPGAPPVINFVSAGTGVNPSVGQPGLYTYKMFYQSPNNRAPQTGYPKVGIDKTGDADFDDAGEGIYSMNKEGTSTDYITGVIYSYTVSYTDYSNTLGYKFFASDDLGNVGAANYVSGPVITFQLPDLKIFANDISFSKNNPLPGEPFTVSANVSNSSAYNVSNVPVKFYRDTILLDSAVIPAVNAFGNSTITKVFSFPTDGFYPIKVWIDSSNTLGESNILNNYAIRPINVGNVVLPGGINATTTALLQSCPQKILISGNAQYFGTASPTVTAGAEVKIQMAGQTFTTYTDAGGNFKYLWETPPCGATLYYTVSITDFTFTSTPITGSISVPCPLPSQCAPTSPQPGVGMVSTFTNPCSLKKGNSGNIDLNVTYRSRNLDNFWNAWDMILQDKIEVYHNGVLIQTLTSADGTTSPGEVKHIPVNITLNATGPNLIEAKLSYIYNEFFDIPGAFNKGVMIPMTGYGSTTLVAETDSSDLTIGAFRQNSFTSFQFADMNITCEDAGTHKVRVFDSIPGSAAFVLKNTYTVSSLAGKTQHTLAFSDPTLSFGTHFIKIVTDTDGEVLEQNENNNEFITSIFVPKPDFTMSEIKPLNTALSVGSKVKFTTKVKNSGTAAGPFKVQFTINGAQIGNKIVVTMVPEKDSVSVVSDDYTVTTNAPDCFVTIAAVADIDIQIDEAIESNNSNVLKFASDIAPYMQSGELGSASNPVIVRASSAQDFHPLVRNIGSRDVSNVTVTFTLDGNNIGKDNIALIRAGAPFAAATTFRQAFTTVGDYVVKISADTLNGICETDETNNIGDFHIRVIATNPDLEVLSQYISPSSLNPNPGQSISIVGTVKNAGLKPTPSTVLRFMVDDIPLGPDVVINGLQPGQDTTVAATTTYASLIPGLKVMKLQVDPANTIVEERENNNEATRILIVGDAPDMARSHAQAIRFNPTGFRSGDSVTISYAIKNNGAQGGTAWVRFLIYDEADGLTGMDSVQFSLAAGATTTVSKKMLFSIEKGMVVTQIVRCSPMEFDLLNNNDTLNFNTVMMLTRNITANNLDMMGGLPDELPGWIGGKLVLGDYDLVINGSINNFDTSHFVVTNGNGRLRLVNGNAVNTFPVGTAVNKTNFVKINNTGAGDNFSVRVLPYVLKNGNSGDTVRVSNVSRTWFIDEQTPGGSNAIIDFSWSTADELPGFDRTQSRTAHFTGSWQFGDMGAAITDSANSFRKSQAGFTSFSPFTITSGAGAALPLRLLQFTVAKDGSKAILNWQTTDEVNTRNFVIQHSANGHQFSDIGTLAAINSNGIHNYQFDHAAVTQGMNYYRLKMIDIDGGFTYSDIKSIRFEFNVILQVFPNPAKQFINVKGLEANGTIQILTLDGRLLQQVITTGNNMQIDLGRLTSGVYILAYRNRDKLQQQKIIKE